MMSGSNPFRRSQVVEPVEDRVPTGPSVQDRRADAAEIEIARPLRIQVPAQTKSSVKRVRIASPPVPVAPETPASYSSSPETARDTSSLPYSPPPTGFGQSPYSQGTKSNPFNPSSTSDGEQDEADEQLVENTRRNAALGKETPTAQVVKEDPVKATLARFVSAPRRRGGPALPSPENEDGNGQQSRQSMDVDAFKRLLLTGVSEAAPGPPATQTKPLVAQSNLTSDSSSSNADTASVSQQSLFDPLVPAASETPRTSYELESEETSINEQDVLLHRNANHIFKKPALPRSRQPNPMEPSSKTHGSPRAMPESHAATSPRDLNKPLPLPPVTNAFPPVHDTDEPTTTPTPPNPRQRPPPPLARRSSQRRTPSCDESLSSTPTSPSYPRDSMLPQSPREPIPKTTPIAPPPPPSRRHKRMSDASQLSAQATVLEADETSDPILTSEPLRISPSPSTSSLSNPKPQPPPSRQASLAKRQSRVLSGSPISGSPISGPPPPPPPPRRARGSSRGSMDSQTVLPFADAGDAAHIPEARSALSSQSMSKDILADLAALQQEVDALRNRQKVPPNG